MYNIYMTYMLCSINICMQYPQCSLYFPLSAYGLNRSQLTSNNIISCFKSHSELCPLKMATAETI